MGFGDSFFELGEAYLKGLEKIRHDYYDRPLWPEIAQKIFDLFVQMHRVTSVADWGSEAGLDIDRVRENVRDELLEHGAFTEEEMSWIE